MQQIINSSEWSAHMIKLIKYHEEKTQYNMGFVDALDQVDDWLCGLPYLDPASLRPKGEWITASFWKSRKGHHVQLVFKKCSLCNFRIKARWENNFCPNCGADMRLAGASPRPTDGGERDS